MSTPDPVPPAGPPPPPPPVVHVEAPGSVPAGGTFKVVAEVTAPPAGRTVHVDVTASAGTSAPATASADVNVVLPPVLQPEQSPAQPAKKEP